MHIIPKLKLECRRCDHRSEMSGALLEERLDEPLSIRSVGQLYGRLRCSQCGRSEVRVLDDAGHLLINPTAITPCALCGQPIPLPRLSAMPNSNVCLACAAGATERPHDPPYPMPPADRQKCLFCGRSTIVRQNKEDEDFFLGCTGFPKCRWTNSLTN